MVREALLAGALNTAIIFDEDGCSVRKPGSVKDLAMDGYFYSQIRAIRPELKIVTFESDEDLSEKLFLENIQQKALNQALEIMDATFSLIYRSKIAIRLVEQLEIHTGLLDFLKNRLYARVLPKSFEPELALTIIGNRHEGLKDIFTGLKEKGKMFGRFYTVFKLELQATRDEQEEIDVFFGDNSVYANFTLALFTKSKTLYDFATSLALEHKKHYPALKKELFAAVQAKIKENYHVTLYSRSSHDYWGKVNHVVYCTHRIYGSPLKAISAFYQEKYPFSPHQMVEVFARRLPYQRSHMESAVQYRCRMFDQTLDEIDFLKRMRMGVIQYEPIQSLNVKELRGYLASPGYVRDFITGANLKDIQYAEITFMTWFADSLLLDERYQDAGLIYENIIQQTHINRRKATYWGDLSINLSITIKLIWILVKTENYEKAGDLSAIIRKLLERYIQNSGTDENQLALMGPIKSLEESITDLISGIL